MKAHVQLILIAFGLSLFVAPVFAANSELVKVYQSCEKEAEKNEVEDKDFRTYMRQCMTDNGMTSADADSTLNELGPPAENQSGNKDES